MKKLIKSITSLFFNPLKRDTALAERRARFEALGIKSKDWFKGPEAKQNAQCPAN